MAARCSCDYTDADSICFIFANLRTHYAIFSDACFSLEPIVEFTRFGFFFLVVVVVVFLINYSQVLRTAQKDQMPTCKLVYSRSVFLLMGEVFMFCFLPDVAIAHVNISDFCKAPLSDSNLTPLHGCQQRSSAGLVSHHYSKQPEFLLPPPQKKKNRSVEL